MPSPVAIATLTLLKLISKYFLVIEYHCQREQNAQSKGISFILKILD